MPVLTVQSEPLAFAAARLQAAIAFLSECWGEMPQAFRDRFPFRRILLHQDGRVEVQR